LNQYILFYLLTNTYISIKFIFRNGSPVPVSKSLQKRYDDVIYDLKYTDFQKSFASQFVTEDFQPVNKGCLNTRTGCFIGIPIIYDFNSIDEITEYVKSEVII